MNWKKRYYQLLDSLQRRKARGGREPRDRQPRQPRSRTEAAPRQAPARASRPVQVRSLRTGRTSRPRLRVRSRTR